MLYEQMHTQVLKHQEEIKKYEVLLKEKEGILIQLENKLLNANKENEKTKEDDKAKKVAAAMAIFNASVNLA